MYKILFTQKRKRFSSLFHYKLMTQLSIYVYVDRDVPKVLQACKKKTTQKRFLEVLINDLTYTGQGI